MDAARRLTRVLPTPAGPTTVTMRAVVTSAVIPASSLVRPTRLVASAGSRPGRLWAVTCPWRTARAMVTSRVFRVTVTITSRGVDRTCIDWPAPRASALPAGGCSRLVDGAGGEQLFGVLEAEGGEHLPGVRARVGDRARSECLDRRARSAVAEP